MSDVKLVHTEFNIQMLKAWKSGESGCENYALGYLVQIVFLFLQVGSFCPTGICMMANEQHEWA